MTADQFKAIRKELGLTQPQWADALGISLRAVQYYEKGREIPAVVGILASTKAQLRIVRELNEQLHHVIGGMAAERADARKEAEMWRIRCSKQQGKDSTSA